MPFNERNLIGSVVERKTPSSLTDTTSSRFAVTPGTGFPAVQHRSTSAFARGREEARRNDGQSRVPTIGSSEATPPGPETKAIPTNVEDLQRQISEENERRISSMTPEEIEQERQEVLEQLGSNASDLLRRVQEARLRKLAREEATKGAEMEKPTQNVSTPDQANGWLVKPTLLPLGARPGILRVKSLENVPQTATTPILVKRSSTRPPSRVGRKIRFAEVTPKDIHVYESAPVSPKRPILALPPPPDKPDSSIISLGTYKAGPTKRPHPSDSPSDEKDSTIVAGPSEPEEGTPEYIRRRYFPDTNADNPSLEWIQSLTSSHSSEPRFDLNGALIPPSLSEALPSHLGLHHHAEGSYAGYTLEDILLLSRSSVPAQRASMLGVLAKIAHNLGQHNRVTEFAGKEDDLRKRILAAGLAAINERGNTAAMAVEVVWECLVVWDSDTTSISNIELHKALDVISLTQPEHLLPIIAEMFVRAMLPPETLEQLLDITYRIAQESNELAELVMNTPRLVSSIVQNHLLTPIPPPEGALLPNPLALQLLITLASASRSNASALLEPSDALLRFVTLLPDSSPFPVPLAASLLNQTLRFYRMLASYGLYAHIATSASHYFSALGLYVRSPPSTSLGLRAWAQLRGSWASLIEAWIACATDPHSTTPAHEILWSQVSAWGWAGDVRSLRKDLTNTELDWEVWSAMWNAEAAWLEGSRVNCVKGGDAERTEVLEFIKSGFETEHGLESNVVGLALHAVKECLGPVNDESGAERHLKSIAVPAQVLCSSIRLWLACLPAEKDVPLESPPFTLPFGELSDLCANLVTHAIWSLPEKRGSYLQVHLRSLTSLLAHFHRLSRHIPGTEPDLWLAQGFSILTRLIPGDENSAIATTENCNSLIMTHFAGLSQLPLITTDILQPFFEHSIRPNSGLYIGPLHVSAESINHSTTLRLPGPCPPDISADQVKSGLPLPRDWLVAPLTHLLRSGTSPVFRALPVNWDASEVDVVRATLLLLYVSRGVLQRWGLGIFVLGPAETVFTCMKVCMLEHGVGNEKSGMDSSAEVFRDEAVERLTGWLLDPFTSKQPSTFMTPTMPTEVVTPALLPPLTPQNYLELASQPFLGQTRTPFYQFYTDLVSLYASVSFAHALFGALLLPPLAMRYAGDYRRLVWCESGDGGSEAATTGVGGSVNEVVRTIRLGLDLVPCCGLGWPGWDGFSVPPDVREYLYPVERDGRILGAYIQALLAGRNAPEGFLRLVAVHHVAFTVWPDLQKLLDEAGGTDAMMVDDGATTMSSASSGLNPAHNAHTPLESASPSRAIDNGPKLLRLLLNLGDDSAVRDVLLYRQSPRGAFIWPPACFESALDESLGKDGWCTGRITYVREVMGDDMGDRVAAIFEQKRGQRI
ncbi:hypothetical protein J3A83DRAFT_4366967 [Scleroderma citrinum]